MSERKTLSLKSCVVVPWHEDPEGHKSPIGSILENVKISSGIGSDNDSPTLIIQITLIGNMRDGRVELTYRAVRSYSMEGFVAGDTLGNTWIEDTLNLRKGNRLQHNVTLTGGNWSIEAEDVDYLWKPLHG